MFISLLTDETKILLSAKLCKKVVGSEMRFYSKCQLIRFSEDLPIYCKFLGDQNSRWP